MAEESNTGGTGATTSKAAPPSRQSGPRYRGRSSHQLLTTDEKVRAFTRLCRSLELQQLVARVGWCDLPWSCPLQPLQSHCHPPLHYSWPPTGPQRPSPRSALSEGPSRHQLKNNFATLCNSFAKPPPRLLWHEKYTLSGRDQSGCQGRGEGLGWQE